MPAAMLLSLFPARYALASQIHHGAAGPLNFAELFRALLSKLQDSIFSQDGVWGYMNIVCCWCYHALHRVPMGDLADHVCDVICSWVPDYSAKCHLFS